MWLALALAWGTAHLFETWLPTLGIDAASPDENYVTSSDNVASEETHWGFGQLLPVVLLLLPLLSIWESFAGKWRQV